MKKLAIRDFGRDSVAVPKFMLRRTKNPACPEAPGPYLRSRLNDLGERPLDLAQRINVLAICIAFAFVGAILLGMF